MTLLEDMEMVQDVVDSGRGKFYVRWKDDSGTWHEGLPLFIDEEAARHAADKLSGLYDSVIEAEVACR